MDVIHRVGLGGDVLFGGLGDGVVLGYVCHFVCISFVKDYVMFGIRMFLMVDEG